MASGGQVDFENYRALRDERDNLADRVAHLESVLFGALWTPADWKLTAANTCLLNLLVVRRFVDPDAWAAAIELTSWRRSDSEDAEHVRRDLTVHISLLRGKVRERGVTINNQWGLGYWLDDASRLFLSQLRILETA